MLKVLLGCWVAGFDFCEGVKLKVEDFQFGWGFGGHWSETECGGNPEPGSD